jgi:hypothetical protein
MKNIKRLECRSGDRPSGPHVPLLPVLQIQSPDVDCTNLSSRKVRPRDDLHEKGILLSPIEKKEA